MRFKGLDLNLLTAFDVLMEVRHVTRAAKRLNLSQSAMSSVLRRLREYFQDPLLITEGKALIPSAHALQLLPAIQEVLAAAEHVVAHSRVFDPATSNRHFRIGAADYVMMIILVPLLKRLELVAPSITFELLPLTDELMSELERGTVDLAVLPDFHLSPDHPAELLFEENHVVQGWAENPVFEKPFTQETFAACGHVAVKLGENRPTSFGEQQLAHMGIVRRVEVEARYFMLLPHLLVGTQRIGITHERAARFFEKILPLRTVALPFPFPKLRAMIQFHSSRTSDSGLRWLIDQLLMDVGAGGEGPNNGAASPRTI